MTFQGFTHDAPRGFVREENTVATLKGGRRMKVKIYHALFGTERKICRTPVEANDWLDSRRVAWREKTSKVNTRKGVLAACNVASARLASAMTEAGHALTPEQIKAVQLAMDALSDAVRRRPPVVKGACAPLSLRCLGG